MLRTLGVAHVEDLPGFRDRRRLPAKFFSNLGHSFDQLIVLLRWIPVGQIDIVLKTDTNDIAAHKNTDGVHWELVAPGGQHFPFPMRKQSRPVLRGKRQRAHGRNHGAESKSIVEPEVFGIAVEHPLLGKAFELMDLADFGDLKLQRRSSLENGLYVLLQKML